jgi:hypothetical protein
MKTEKTLSTRLVDPADRLLVQKVSQPRDFIRTAVRTQLATRARLDQTAARP